MKIFKTFVLGEVLELNEQPIHFSNASGRLLSISDEFRGEYGCILGVYQGVYFFHAMFGYDSSQNVITWNQHSTTSTTELNFDIMFF